MPQQSQNCTEESGKCQADVQGTSTNGARKAVAVRQQPQRIHVVVHEAVEQNI